MDKVIATALLTIAAVIAAVMMINVAIPGVNRSTAALSSANNVSVERIKTSVEIVYAYGDTTSDQIVLYAKNVGNTTIVPMDANEVFLTTPTEAKRLPYGTGLEYWTYQICDGEDKWSQRVTVEFTLHLTALGTGIHKITLVTSNGTAVEHEFGIS